MFWGMRFQKPLYHRPLFFGDFTVQSHIIEQTFIIAFYDFIGVRRHAPIGGYIGVAKKAFGVAATIRRDDEGGHAFAARSPCSA